MKNKKALENYIDAIRNELYKRLEIDGENCISDMVDISDALDNYSQEIEDSFRFQTPIKDVIDEMERGGDFTMMKM